MTADTDTSYLSALLDWAENEVIVLNRREVENRWMSVPLPTRRFGPDAWAMFSMQQIPGQSQVGPFHAWILLADVRPRVIAYLESPIANTFGTVDPFAIEGAGLNAVEAALWADVGLAGTAFFDGLPATGKEAQVVGRLFDQVGHELGARLRDVAPDFFAWAERAADQAGGDRAG